MGVLVFTREAASWIGTISELTFDSLKNRRICGVKYLRSYWDSCSCWSLYFGYIRCFCCCVIFLSDTFVVPEHRCLQMKWHLAIFRAVEYDTFMYMYMYVWRLKIPKTSTWNIAGQWLVLIFQLFQICFCI